MNTIKTLVFAFLLAGSIWLISDSNAKSRNIETKHQALLREILVLQTKSVTLEDELKRLMTNAPTVLLANTSTNLPKSIEGKFLLRSSALADMEYFWRADEKDNRVELGSADEIMDIAQKQAIRTGNGKVLSVSPELGVLNGRIVTIGAYVVYTGPPLPLIRRSE